ncbi:MAG: TonB family protein [Bacteroidales bacterium]
MWSIISYFFESLLCGSVLFLLFYLMQKVNINYNFRRIFILISSVSVALFPLIKISSGIVPRFGILLDPVTINGEQSGLNGVTQAADGALINIVIFIYFSVCALFLMFIIIHFVKIVNLQLKSEQIKGRLFTLIINDSVQVPFSFLNSIFINRNTGDSEREYILKHEYSHIARRHSIDVIIINLISVFQWFNPFITLLKRSLIETHEFQADKDVLEGGLEIDIYRSLLLNTQFGVSPYLSSNLNKSLTLKRFKKMENLEQKRAGFFAVATSLLTLALLFTVISFTSAKEPVNNIETNKAEIKVLPDTLKNEIPFMKVEVKPTFMGGDENTFTKWIAERLVYPAEAKTNGKQGRIILQFVITSTGKLSDVKILKGVDPSLDKEAVRVVSSSPLWKPGEHEGKKVDVVYQFPVIFQLR